MIQSRTYAFAATVGVVIFIALRYRQNRQYDRELHDTTPSPLQQVERTLSKAEKAVLAYHPEQFPGVRDVNTPWGNTRVYEFGPEDGVKVLFVHGISTPCISLGRLSEFLVSKGCRVILYDLFGRGYSDHPTKHHYSSQLFISQILCVLASSPISWTGNNAFSIIGYSLGGGISASFTNHFPELVKSLVLIAPGGLQREKHTAWQSYVLYRTEGILPDMLVRWMVRRRLNNPSANSPVTPNDSREGILEVKSVSAAEIGNTRAPGKEMARRIDRAVQWQLDNHPGFVPAFISSIRHAPIMNQYGTYLSIGARQEKLKKHNLDIEKYPEGLLGGRAILILGQHDGIVLPCETDSDHRTYLGDDNLETIILDGGHDLPVSQPEELGQRLWETWERLKTRQI